MLLGHFYMLNQAKTAETKRLKNDNETCHIHVFPSGGSKQGPVGLQPRAID